MRLTQVERTCVPTGLQARVSSQRSGAPLTVDPLAQAPQQLARSRLRKDVGILHGGPALFLASAASDDMTGQLLIVDGGCMAK